MGWIDVAIPGGIGLLLVAAPGLFSKPMGEAESDASNAIRMRGIGACLLALAGMYLLIKMVSTG